MDFHALVLRVPMILFAITIHEYMHARAALFFGDETAKMQGRVTLNPIAHLDPIGAFCLVFMPIGWGKPVPVNPYNLSNPRRDDMFISVAGPASNVAAALLIGLVLRLVPWVQLLGSGRLGPGASKCLWSVLVMLYIGLQLNLGLAIFNMLPLFPLDGSHVLKGLLPREYVRGFEQFSRFAPGILLGLILFEYVLHVPLLSRVIFPPIQLLTKLIAGSSLGV